MSHFIAVITTAERYYDEDQYTLITSITDWEEVSDEDFQLLTDASRNSYKYRNRIPPFQVIERPKDLRGFVLKTIADYKECVQKELEREEKIRQQRADAYQKKKKESAVKRAERLRAQLVKLEAEESV